MSKSNREKGAELENYFRSTYAGKVTQTNNSGAVSGNGDFIDHENNLMFDCKNHTTSDAITLSANEFNRLQKQALNYNKDWVLIYKNKSGKLVACLEYELFNELIMNKNG